MRILDFSDGFSSNSAPTQGSVAQNAYAVYASDGDYVTAKGSAAAEGDAYYNSTTDQVRVHDGVQFTDLVGVQNVTVGINYITNSSGDSTSGWVTFADAAASTPVDGTGGVPTVTIASSASTPLRGDFSFLLTKSAVNLQGNGVSYDFTIANADKNKRLLISFDYEVAGSFVTGSASDVGVWIYDVTNTTLITPDNVSILQSSGRFETTFNATSSTSYRLIYFVRTTNAAAWTFKFDDVVVSPQTLTVQSAPLSDWVDWPTPSGTWVTNAVYSGKYRRVGGDFEGFLKITLTGAPTAAALVINLPTGFTVDTSAIPGGALDSILQSSDSVAIDAAPAGQYNLAVQFETTSSLRVVSYQETGTFVRGDSVSNVAPITFASGDRLYLRFKVPVTQWDSNIIMSNTRTVRMGSLLQFGTRVTATPANLGEYRCLIKAAGSLASTDDAPATAPTAADGMRIYGNANFASAGSAGQTNKWVIYVGTARSVDVRFFASAGMTGHASASYEQISSTDARGIVWNYDPTTGLVVVDAIEQASTTTTRNAGVTLTSGTTASASATNFYFDVLVSQTPLPIEASHASTHVLGGSDAIDADTAAIDYVPTQYTRTPSAPYSSLNGHLSAHLNGINAKFAAGLSYSQVQDTGTFSTTSVTYVTITTMTVTPAAGTYLVLFSASGSSSAGNNDVDYAIHLNAVEDTSSTRRFSYDGGADTNAHRKALQTQAVVVTPGSQAIDVRIRTNAGTMSVYDRNLILVRLV